MASIDNAQEPGFVGDLWKHFRCAHALHFDSWGRRKRNLNGFTWRVQEVFADEAANEARGPSKTEPPGE